MTHPNSPPHLALFWFLLLLCLHAAFQKKPWEYEGTTPNIKDIVIGRCYQYLEISRTNRADIMTIDVDCNALWNRFRSAWAGKDPCEKGAVTEKSFDAFFSLVRNEKKVKDQLLFYSGLRRITQDFTQVNDNYFTLERTISGYIANDLTWCACTGESATCVDGIDYKMCKKCPKDVHTSNYIYWQAASKNFARRASGTASVMLNGSKDGDQKAYNDKSFFTNYELPELTKLGREGIVRKLVILVISDLGKKLKEPCEKADGSVALLVRDAKRLGMRKVRCIDDPKVIVNILCAKNPNAKECKYSRHSFKRLAQDIYMR